MNDHMDEAGARNLAGRIRAHWAEKGFDVQTEIQIVSLRSGRSSSVPIWIVRSDMVNGLPQRKLQGARAA